MKGKKTVYIYIYIYIYIITFKSSIERRVEVVNSFHKQIGQSEIDLPVHDPLGCISYKERGDIKTRNEKKEKKH